jgi:hypothetical protein
MGKPDGLTLRCRFPHQWVMLFRKCDLTESIFTLLSSVIFFLNKLNTIIAYTWCNVDSYIMSRFLERLKVKFFPFFL